MLELNIKEVAEKAGVSITTVSRVLNSPEKVNEKTKQKILETMEELNYTPNWFARNLQNSRTNIIGVLVPDTMQQTDMAIAKGIEKIAVQKGSHIILCTTGADPETEKNQVRNLIERKVDGLVMISSVLDKNEIAYIKERKVPFVFVDKSPASENENEVFTNYDAAAEEVISYMADMGRKKIAIILPDNQKSTNERKLSGYMNGLKANGLEFEEVLHVIAENTIEGGFVAADKLMHNMEGLDGIFAGTDIIAFGALEAMHQNGFSPETLGIVGFNGNEEGAVVEPKLTTVVRPSYRMGLTAARLLFDMIEEDEENIPQSIMMKSKLKIRKSCGNTERILEIW